MLTLKENPVGVDLVINEINNLVYNELNFENYEAYHRAFKQQSERGVIPEAFIYDTRDYKECFYDDRVNSSFFYTSDSTDFVDNGRLVNTTVSMVFQVNLDEVAPAIKHRGDEEIHRVVVNAINKSVYGTVSSLVVGIDNVYNEFDTTQITYTDMQPFHCFRVDIDVSYAYGCCADGCGLVIDETGFLQTVDGGNILLANGYRIIINN